MNQPQSDHYTISFPPPKSTETHLIRAVQTHFLKFVYGWVEKGTNKMNKYHYTAYDGVQVGRHVPKIRRNMLLPFQDKPHFYAVAHFSTLKAEEIPPKRQYLTLHCVLPKDRTSSASDASRWSQRRQDRHSNI